MVINSYSWPKWNSYLISSRLFQCYAVKPSIKRRPTRLLSVRSFESWSWRISQWHCPSLVSFILRFFFVKLLMTPWWFFWPLHFFIPVSLASPSLCKRVICLLSARLSMIWMFLSVPEICVSLVPVSCCYWLICAWLVFVGHISKTNIPPVYLYRILCFHHS